MTPGPQHRHPQHPQKIAALYQSARALEPAARAAFLLEVCAGDNVLRLEIEALLTEEATRTFAMASPVPRALDDSVKTKSIAGVGVEPVPGIASSRFRVNRRVGAGGMGVVFEAWDQELGVRSALKTLTGFDPNALYLFKNEFRSLADISHPNLVALYELFSEQGQWFFSMEYVEGVHFLEFLRPAGQLAPTGEDVANGDRLRSALGQLTHAVLALHDAGILHRDLKPANVKVTPEGRVVVLDFGLAAHRARFSEATVHPGLFGTVAYMAPELARGEPIAEPADWYAVGVMLYEALTGRRPFEGPATRVIEDKRTLEPPAASNFVPNIPDDLNTICAGLLACDPAQRITGRQVLALLRWDSRETGKTPSHVSASGPHSGETVFVGRETQLAVLRDAFAATENGTPCAVFVHGKSGIGKSALIERFLNGVAGQGDVVILAGRCYEQESLPYKALDSAVDSLSRYLARLSRHEAAEFTPRDAAALAQIFPVLRRVEAIADAPQRSGPALERHELRRRAFGALRELLARLGDRRRVVLYIDDLQWGDFDSAQLLTEILRPPEAPALLLIGAYREEEARNSPFLKEFLKNDLARPDLDIRDVPVNPLNAEEAGKLAVALLARSSETSGRAEQIARESGGNPYFVQELIAAAGTEHAQENNAPETSLDDALWARVTELPADARRVLEAIAVSGQPIEEKVVCEAAEATRDPKLFGILRSARMIRGSSSGERSQVEAWHDRVRETVVAHLDPPARARYHLRLGESLESSGSVDAERVATHFEGAGEATRAGRYYGAAAEAASSALAFKHAAGLFRKSLDLLQPEGDDKVKLTVRLADALANAGRGVEAARQYQWAAQAAAGPAAMDLERRAAYWFSVSGHVDDGREALDQLLLRIGVNMPARRLLWPAIVIRELQLRLHGLKVHGRTEDRIPRLELERLDALWDATRAFAMIDIPTGVYCNLRHLLLALKAGEPNRIARAMVLGALGASVLPVVGRTRGSSLLAVLEKLASDVPTPYVMGALPFTRSTMEFCLTGRWEVSLAGFRDAGQIFEEKCSGVAWEVSTIHIFILWSLLYLGRYSELSQLAAAYVRDGEEKGDLFKATSIGSAMLPFSEMAAGRPERALILLEEALSRWTRRKYTFQIATSAYVRAWILLYQGDGAAARKFLQGEWPELGRNLYLHVNAVWQWLLYTRAQSALAEPHSATDLKEVLRVAGADAHRLERDSSGYSRPLAHLIRAGCAARQGDLVTSARLLESAVAEFNEYGMSMMAAAAKFRLGEIAGGEQGRSLIHEAEAAMLSEGVADPARLTNVFVNGFGAR